MKNKIWIVVLLALCVFIPSMAFAETVVLKSGQTIEGNLLEKTDKYIKIDFEGVVLTYYLEEIARIDKEKKDDPSLLENTPDKEEAQAEESSISVIVLKEGPAGIQQINEAYYNMSRLGFQKFDCELTINTFESLKEMLKSKHPATDPKSKVLDSVKFYASFDKNSMVGFNHTSFSPLGDVIIDNAIRECINDARIKLGMFFNSWGAYALDLYRLPPERDYTIEKLPNGYAFSYNDRGTKGRVLMDNKLCFFEEDYKFVGLDRKIKTHYIYSKQGLLLQFFDDDSSDSINKFTEKVSATISYQEVDGFQVPKQASIKINSLENQGIVEIKFFDYKIKKIP